MLACRGERGKSAPAIFLTSFSCHKPGFGKAVDRPCEAARGQIRLGGEVAHAQPPARSTGQPYQDLEILAGEVAMTFQRRVNHPVQA